MKEVRRILLDEEIMAWGCGHTDRCACTVVCKWSAAGAGLPKGCKTLVAVGFQQGGVSSCDRERQGRLAASRLLLATSARQDQVYLPHYAYQFVTELAFPVLRCDDAGLWYVGGVSKRESGPPAEASFSLMFVGPPSLSRSLPANSGGLSMHQRGAFKVLSSVWSNRLWSWGCDSREEHGTLDLLRSGLRLRLLLPPTN